MTNTEADKFGFRLGHSTGEVSAEDISALQEFRQTFKEPLAEVFSFVSAAARKLDKGCIVTYRIKRLDTIIEKLRRFSGNENGGMRLSRMWDIAGCRCIFSVSDEDKLYQMLDIIRKEYGEDCKVNDYVREGPRASGYRSIHIYVKDRQTGKPVEIQIRNYIQHNWATLVEILDVLYRKSIKEGREHGEFERFLLLYSRASSLNVEEFTELLTIESKNRIFETMSATLTGNYLNVKRQWLLQPVRGSFFVIVASNKGSHIQSFRSFDEAEADYYEKYVANRDSNIVLTHIPAASFDQISMAYSNYVLAMHAFFDDYRILVADMIVSTIEYNSYLNFFRLCRIYNRNLSCHINNLKTELATIKAYSREGVIKSGNIRKWKKDIEIRIHRWQNETALFLSKLDKACSRKRLARILVKMQLRRMEKVVYTNKQTGK